MTDQATNGRKMFASVTLETPIERGEEKIVDLTLRRPKSGELRGLSLAKLGQMDVSEIIKLLPRISSPALLETEAAAIDPADLMEIAGELGDFLLTKQRMAELPTT